MRVPCILRLCAHRAFATRVTCARPGQECRVVQSAERTAFDAKGMGADCFNVSMLAKPEYAYDSVANKSTPSLDQQALGFQVEYSVAAKLLYDY